MSVQCDKQCYKNGRGCFISPDGKCPHYFPEDKKITVKSFKEAYEAMQSIGKHGLPRTK